MKAGGSAKFAKSRKRAGQPVRSAAKKERTFGMDPLLLEIHQMLGPAAVRNRMEQQSELEVVHPPGTMLQVQIETLASLGVGIARDPTHPDWAIAVPKSLPGDRLKVQVTSNVRMRSEAVIVEVLEQSAMRTQTPPCKHFHSCGGCQYQMLS